MSIKVAALLFLALPLLAQQPAKPFPEDIGADRVEIYKTAGDVSLRVHIWEPDRHRAEDVRPAIVFFFGGGWRGGSPAQFQAQCRYLATRGMVAMSAEYRIRGLHETLAKTCVEDGKSALRWVRQHAKRLGVDPQRIAAGGGSAGGHVAACTGVVPGFDAADEDASVSSRPNAMVLFNPPLVLAPVEGVRGIDPEQEKTLSERMGVEPKALSPYHHLASGQAPMLVLHGEADTVVFIEGVRAFVAASSKLGNRCELAAYAGEGHGFFNFRRKPTPMYAATVSRMDAFLVSLGWLPVQRPHP